MSLPLAMLAVLSLAGGFLFKVPEFLEDAVPGARRGRGHRC